MMHVVCRTGTAFMLWYNWAGYQTYQIDVGGGAQATMTPGGFTTDVW
jgi:hypothetical protein